MKYILLGAILVSCVSATNALVINEIMYNPQGADTGREWIEVFNNGSSTIDMSAWKVFENNINHGITSYQGGTILSANEYAIIADNPQKFLVDYPSYQGVLLNSAFSLSNSGDTISLKNASSTTVDTVDYTPYVTIGGYDDGSSLSLIGTSWVRSKATPGTANIADEKSAKEASSSSATVTSQTTIPQMSPPSADIVLYVPAEKLAIAGADTTFTASGLTRSGKEISDLIFTWAFGDGGQGTGSPTKYRYVYSGRYIAHVEATNQYLSGTGRINVRVVAPDISINSVGVGKYGTYIDVKNPNAYELDLSGWVLSFDGASFPFPKHTFIAPQSTTRFSGGAMGFASLTLATSTVIKILFPNLEEVTRYVILPETMNVPSVIVVASTSTKQSVLRYVSAKSPMVAGVASTTVLRVSDKAQKTNKDTRFISWVKKLFSW